MLGSLRSGSIERRRVGAGAKDISQVPVQWGVHEDVFCAVLFSLLHISSPPIQGYVYSFWVP